MATPGSFDTDSFDVLAFDPDAWDFGDLGPATGSLCGRLIVRPALAASVGLRHALTATVTLKACCGGVHVALPKKLLKGNSHRAEVLDLVDSGGEAVESAEAAWELLNSDGTPFDTPVTGTIPQTSGNNYAGDVPPEASATLTLGQVVLFRATATDGDRKGEWTEALVVSYRPLTSTP